MKREAVQVGKVYANGATPPLLRKITGEGPQFCFADWQEDRDCVGYQAYRWNEKAGKYRPSGMNLKCTRASFASWAKREATAEEMALLPDLP